jgi:hypothetical protein
MDAIGAVLLTGAYGTGKSTVVEEIADLLEIAGEPYAAIDLDWLAWSNAPGAGHDETALLATNLRAVASTFRAAGARRFALAGSVDSVERLGAIRDALAMPVLVVRLTVPLTEIERRLGRAPTRARRDDLAAARAWVEAGAGEDLEDAVLDNTGSPRATARRVIDLAGWPAPPPDDAP